MKSCMIEARKFDAAMAKDILALLANAPSVVGNTIQQAQIIHALNQIVRGELEVVEKDTGDLEEPQLGLGDDV